MFKERQIRSKHRKMRKIHYMSDCFENGTPITRS